MGVPRLDCLGYTRLARIRSFLFPILSLFLHIYSHTHKKKTIVDALEVADAGFQFMHFLCIGRRAAVELPLL